MVVQADGLTVAANVVGSHYDSGGGSFAAGICGWFEQIDSLFNSVKWTERQVKGEECEERGIEKKGLRKEKVNAIGVKHVFCHVHITGATMVPLPITTSSEALLSLSLSLQNGVKDRADHEGAHPDASTRTLRPHLRRSLHRHASIHFRAQARKKRPLHTISHYSPCRPSLSSQIRS